MRLLAHRGWWKKPEEKNGEAAIRRALKAGYGIEIDIRDHNGEVVISHDMPHGKGLMSLSALFEIYSEIGSKSMLALNVKADGLQQKVKEAIVQNKIAPKSLFFFDMSLPDALGYLKHGLPCYTRISDEEPEPFFLDSARGIWVDGFSRDFTDCDRLFEIIMQGREIALVSPELHGRNYKNTWEEWKTLLHRVKQENKEHLLYLCTDVPDKAEAYFGS